MKKLFAAIGKMISAARERHVAEAIRRIDQGGALTARGARHF